MKGYLTVVLICIFLRTRGIEYLSICLLAICESSLEKDLFKPCDHFLIGLYVFLLLSCKCFLYILDTSYILDIY